MSGKKLSVKKSCSLLECIILLSNFFINPGEELHFALFLRMYLSTIHCQYLLFLLPVGNSH